MEKYRYNPRKFKQEIINSLTSIPQSQKKEIVKKEFPFQPKPKLNKKIEKHLEKRNQNLLKKIYNSVSFDNSSTKRLLKDLKEIQKNPLPTVFASPIENDLYEWHVNLMGPVETTFEGVFIHIILKIPQNYPSSAPRVELMTPINRSHVYGRNICLDMLETHFTNNLYTGWSTGYSILRFASIAIISFI
jgi:ubiquitin-protein ligase